MTRILNNDRLCVGARTFHAARARQKLFIAAPNIARWPPALLVRPYPGSFVCGCSILSIPRQVSPSR